MAIAERATAELRGDGQPASYMQSSTVTATTVKEFFKKLPDAVVQHEEGQQTIMQVMALLEKLDAAAQAASAPAAQAAAGSSLPLQPAEAAAPAAAGPRAAGRPADSPSAAGDTTAEEDEQDDDEEMDDAAVATATSNADQAELAALKFRLQEHGIWVRCTRPKGKLVKK